MSLACRVCLPRDIGEGPVVCCCIAYCWAPGCDSDACAVLAPIPAVVTKSFTRRAEVRPRLPVPAGGLPPGDPRHGTANGYNNLGCRCDACRTGATEDRQRRKAYKERARVS